MKPSFYVFSIQDWEDYIPYWFACNCSKKDFDREIKKAINKAINNIIKNGLADYKIRGRELIEATIPLLEAAGLKHIKPDHEVFLRAFLSNRDDKPKFISEKNWKQIQRYNAKKHKEFYKKT